MLSSFIIQVIRYTLGFCWIYQGLMPKLLTIAPLEKALTVTMGFSPAVSDNITRAAGVAEIVFGILLIVFYQHRSVHLLNIAALCGLLGYVVFMMPVLLLEAFNPVTTNIPMMIMSLVLLDHFYGDRLLRAK